MTQFLVARIEELMLKGEHVIDLWKWTNVQNLVVTNKRLLFRVVAGPLTEIVSYPTGAVASPRPPLIYFEELDDIESVASYHNRGRFIELCYKNGKKRTLSPEQTPTMVRQIINALSVNIIRPSLVIDEILDSDETIKYKY